MTAPVAAWARPWLERDGQPLPVVAYPPPKKPDPGPREREPKKAPAGPVVPAAGVAWAGQRRPLCPAPAAPAPPPWRPARAAVSQSKRRPAPPSHTVTWSVPAPVRPAQARPGPSGRVMANSSITSRPCYDGPGGINIDPPDIAMGTGLIASLADGSMCVQPLSVIEPGSTIGDEGPINECFLITPVVRLAAGRPFALASNVVIPDGATLYLNRASIDKSMITIGEGAVVVD